MIKKNQLMLVEDTIKKLNYPQPEELFKKLQGKINKKDFESMLGYLLLHKYILLDKGEIVWIHGGRTVDNVLSNKKQWITV